MLLTTITLGTGNSVTSDQILQVLLYLAPFIPIVFIIHKAIVNSVTNNLQKKHDELLIGLKEQREALDLEVDDMKGRILTLEIKNEERDKAVEKIEKKIEEMFNKIADIYTIVVRLEAKDSGSTRNN